MYTKYPESHSAGHWLEEGGAYQFKTVVDVNVCGGRLLKQSVVVVGWWK